MIYYSSFYWCTYTKALLYSNLFLVLPLTFTYIIFVLIDLLIWMILTYYPRFCCLSFGLLLFSSSLGLFAVFFSMILLYSSANLLFSLQDSLIFLQEFCWSLFFSGSICCLLFHDFVVSHCKSVVFSSEVETNTAFKVQCSHSHMNQ